MSVCTDPTDSVGAGTSVPDLTQLLETTCSGGLQGTRRKKLGLALQMNLPSHWCTKFAKVHHCVCTRCRTLHSQIQTELQIISDMDEIKLGMAWQRRGKHLIQRASLIPSALAPSILQPKALPGNLHQRPRYVHNRLQSDWDAAKTNVARVPSLLPLRARGEMSFCKKFTSVVVLGGMTIGGVCVYDDYLIFQQCSKKALAKANNDSELKAIVGEKIDKGPWYEASMTVDHEGHSAACSFPVTGSMCSANIHLRAVRYEETNSFVSYFVLPGSGEWELVVLEALMHRPASGDQQNPERIDLLRSDYSDAPGCSR